MSIMIRKMTNKELDTFYQWSVDHHVKELMEECQMPQEEAVKETIEAELLMWLGHSRI